jgi:hypothetical protein
LKDIDFYYLYRYLSYILLFLFCLLLVKLNSIIKIFFFLISSILNINISIYRHLQLSSIASGIFSMIGTYYIIGFAYSLFLLIITLFVLAHYRMYSVFQYKGLWCEVFFCLQRGKCRIYLRGLFKVIYIILTIISLAIIAI